MADGSGSREVPWMALRARSEKWPREKSQKKFKESIRDKTPRSNGKSMETVIVEVNRTLRGWGNYFQGGVENVPERLEKWVIE